MSTITLFEGVLKKDCIAATHARHDAIGLMQDFVNL